MATIIGEANRKQRIAKVRALADHVFANPEKAVRWLQHSDYRLQGKSPMQLLRSKSGCDLVEEMLYQIDEGMFV